MPSNIDANITTADVLTLLLHNQYALAAAIEEVAVCVRSGGGTEAHINTITALETLDANAAAISDGIFKLRQ